jgi:hypothetical protein
MLFSLYNIIMSDRGFPQKEANLEMDYRFGEVGEFTVIPYLEKYYNERITRHSRYAKTDCSSDTKHLEIKTRTNSLSAFSTTLMPVHKIIKTNKQIIFVFNFSDCIAVIDYDKELFKPWIAPFNRNTKIELGRPSELYFHIPIEKLTVIHTYLPKIGEGIYDVRELKGRCLISI